MQNSGSTLARSHGLLLVSFPQACAADFFTVFRTFFKPSTGTRVKSIKKWIAFGVRTKGSIIIDRGAQEAVIKKGKSILPVGITGVKGRFNRGDTLKVLSPDDAVIAKGISSFSSQEIKKIMGKNEKSILPQYGEDMCGEVIHRDCLVVFDPDV